MPTYKPYTKHHLDFALKAIGEAIYTPVAPLAIQAWCTKEPIPWNERQSGTHHHFRVGEAWGELFDCAWFHFKGVVPSSAAGQTVAALLDVSGEMCVFASDGVPVRGLTNISSDYDYSLGTPGKRIYPITSQASGGEVVEIWADAGCNDLFGNLQDGGVIKIASIAVCNETVRGLYYDFEVLLDFLNVLPEKSPRYQQILSALNDVAHALYAGVPQAAADGRAILRPHLSRQGGDAALRISAVGHAHMDLAWLWPIRETIRKGARTFATALANMERYPDYVFGASQPQYFQWMKDFYPALYSRIKAAVAAGRIEPQGAMWVEADTNISGGEALVRQILYGKRFFRQEFGKELDYLWLPDVFGYSAALPQLLKKAGVKSFSTQKLSWSLINAFPHQSFRWQGIDGSAVLAHMLPEETYNSPALPRSVRKIEENYRDSGVSTRALLVFGIGDGGGGPGEEHLERLARLGNLEGLSPVRQETVAHFLPDWAKDADRFATWVGELYLERHEGTLTTNARNKWYNRKLELGLRELEFSALLSGAPYPAEWLGRAWREVLLYQFHDILPGSSIKRVYDESLARYKALHAELSDLTAAADRHLAGKLSAPDGKPYALVVNSLSWQRTGWARMDDQWVWLDVPPMGYALVSLVGAVVPSGLSATPDGMENDLLRVTFAADGAISSLLDKRSGREILPSGEHGNRLLVYRDLGDAWDFPMDYAEQTPLQMQLVDSEARLDGPRAIVKQTYQLGSSQLVQEIVLTLGSPRLDFVTWLQWREPQTMLRTSFPVLVQADEATYEIQFGHIRRPTHRNTTWDLARDEVVGHKWADLSQRDYGVALLNDSKYGYKIKGHVLDLNLLRSVPYPRPPLPADAVVQPGGPNHAFTDQADHVFTYALYPHSGDAIAGGVIQAAYEFNAPIRIAKNLIHHGATVPSLPARYSLLQVDAPNVVIEAVKRAEDSPAIIVRLYECEGRSARCNLRCGFPVTSATEVDLMEENHQPLSTQQNTVDIQFHPFEIKTVCIN